MTPLETLPSPSSLPPPPQKKKNFLDKCSPVTQEAANNNIFSDPTNRVLNLGLAVASWSHVAVLLPLVGTDMAGPLALPLTVLWGGAGLATSLIAAFPK